MSNITVKFIGKEYSIPEDVLTYIDLLVFTDGVHKYLSSTFVRKLRNEIAKDNIGLLGDEDLATEIEQQVGKFIAKLCDNGIFTRTISDYLKNNKGYQLYSDVNKAALEKMKSLLIQEMDAWQAGYENAVNKAESHVTGMGFSIWSSSFVNHAIYAAMEASTLNKQGKEAEAQYQKDMNDLRSRLDSQYGGEKSNYINNTYIPNMEAALTVFAYELLDKYVADLITYGKFDGKTLDYVDIGRSNDLLKNLTLSNNKQAVLENAFAACPYNIAVYMQAMKYELLDFDSFQTAKVFKQHDLILSFLNESWGEVSFPAKFNINYYCIDVWASFTGKTSVELLRSLTDRYVSGIIKAYSRVAEMLTNKQLCRKVIGDCSEDEILTGDAICKTKAHYYVNTIVSSTIWDQLTEKCGHSDLLDRIKKCIPSLVDASSKEEYDRSLVEQLYSVFATERRILAAEIEKRLEAEAVKKAEQEKQEQERRKRNKKIAAVAIPVIIVVVAFVIVLNSVIIPNGKYDAAIELMNDGKYEDAIAAFEDMDGYKDSFEKIEECQIAILDVKYGSAITLMHNGQYNEAISTFEELRGHMDSEAKIEECRIAIMDIQYAEAIELMNQKKYNEAISAFELLSGYRESEKKINECNTAILDGKYSNAIALLDAGKLNEAYSAFQELGTYRDASDKSRATKLLINKEILKNANAGDYVKFGSYYGEDIEWLVLEIKDGKAFVISRYLLDCKQYNVSYTDVTWETCTLRNWLNDSFFNAAFSADEKAMIPTVTVTPDKNPDCDTNSGNATQDKVFLLSITEVNRYFDSDSERQCAPTDYAIANGVDVSSFNGNCYWWLRTPGRYQDKAAAVANDGRVIEFGLYVEEDDNAVRPALWIEIGE